MSFLDVISFHCFFFSRNFCLHNLSNQVIIRGHVFSNALANVVNILALKTLSRSSAVIYVIALTFDVETGMNVTFGQLYWKLIRGVSV